MKRKQITDEEFNMYLDRIVAGMTTEQIRWLPGVEEIIREELNNDAIDLWELEQDEDE